MAAADKHRLETPVRLALGLKQAGLGEQEALAILVLLQQGLQERLPQIAQQRAAAVGVLIIQPLRQ